MEKQVRFIATKALNISHPSYLLSEVPIGVTWFYRRMLDKTDEVIVRL